MSVLGIMEIPGDGVFEARKYFRAQAKGRLKKQSYADISQDNVKRSICV